MTDLTAIVATIALSTVSRWTEFPLVSFADSPDSDRAERYRPALARCPHSLYRLDEHLDE